MSAFGKIAKAAKPEAGFATPSAQARGRLKSAFAPSPVLDKLGLDAAFSPTEARRLVMEAVRPVLLDDAGNGEVPVDMEGCAMSVGGCIIDTVRASLDNILLLAKVTEDSVEQKDRTIDDLLVLFKAVAVRALDLQVISTCSSTMTSKSVAAAVVRSARKDASFLFQIVTESLRTLGVFLFLDELEYTNDARQFLIMKLDRALCLRMTVMPRWGLIKDLTTQIREEMEKGGAEVTDSAGFAVLCDRFVALSGAELRLRTDEAEAEQRRQQPQNMVGTGVSATESNAENLGGGHMTGVSDSEVETVHGLGAIPRRDVWERWSAGALYDKLVEWEPGAFQASSKGRWVMNGGMLASCGSAACVAQNLGEWMSAPQKAAMHRVATAIFEEGHSPLAKKLRFSNSTPDSTGGITPTKLGAKGSTGDKYGHSSHTMLSAKQISDNPDLAFRWYGLTAFWLDGGREMLGKVLGGGAKTDGPNKGRILWQIQPANVHWDDREWTHEQLEQGLASFGEAMQREGENGGGVVTCMHGFGSARMRRLRLRGRQLGSKQRASASCRRS